MLSADPGDDRPLEANISRLVARNPTELAGFWSFTYHLNRLYAMLHGYRFWRPELNSKVVREWLADGEKPPRRIQWAIVRLVLRQLEDASCEYVVWLDSDAYVASSEPLESLLTAHGLLNATAEGALAPWLVRPGQRLFLFAAATHARMAGPQLVTARDNISDHFMVVRNTPAARALIRRWWRLPQRKRSFARFREHLFLEQTVMNELFPRYPHLLAPAPPLWHFEGFRGRFVRHVGGIKDVAFQVALRDALLARIMAPVAHPDSAWAKVIRHDAVAARLLRKVTATTWSGTP